MAGAVLSLPVGLHAVNSGRMKSNPTTIAVTPLRPPATTPAALSM